jgi:phosphoglycerol transferase MdoB-like AlkP superfamily enzyme
MYLYFILLNIYFRIFIFTLYPNNIYHWRVPFKGILNDLVAAGLFYLAFRLLWFIIRPVKIRQTLLLVFVVLWTALNYVNYQFAVSFNSLLPLSWFDEIANVGAMGAGGGDLFRSLLTFDMLKLVVLPLFVSSWIIYKKSHWLFKNLKIRSLFIISILSIVAQSNTLHPDIQPKRHSIVHSHIFKYWYYKQNHNPLADIRTKPLPQFSENFKKIVLEKQPDNGLLVPIIKQKQPNIVIIMLESFRAYDVGVYGGTENTSPNFDKYSKSGILFKNIYSAGRVTKSGQWSIMCGQNIHAGKAVLRYYKDHGVKCLPDYLAESGYDTWWFHGQSASYDSAGYFFKKHQIKHIMDRLSFPVESEVMGWGLADFDLVKLALNNLKNTKSPFFWIVQSQSNHHPFETPEEFKTHTKYGDKLNNYLNSFSYTDYCLGYFLDRFLKTEQGKNSVILITADHGVGVQRTDPKRSPRIEVLAKYMVPFLILYPESEALNPMVIDNLGSHTDIFPTLMDILGKEEPYPNFGKSLVRDYKYRFAKGYVNGNWIVVGNKMYSSGVTNLDGEKVSKSKDDSMWFNLKSEIDDIQDWIIQEKDTNNLYQKLNERNWKANQ